MRKHWMLLVLITACLASAAPAEITILHEFAGGAGDGGEPFFARVTLTGNTLYGMTSGGGERAEPSSATTTWSSPKYRSR